ncbi:MAG TPA: peptidoglycan-binding domain-containing protein [Polyangia bacterium]|jgi:hypothetical protein|nr:peptidoglycan-binding domain-containing protein [Polyangia bacterium]
MRFLMTGVVVSLAVTLGCGHTKSVSDTDNKEKTKAESKPESGKTAPDADGKRHAARTHHGATSDQKTEHGVPIATSPAGLLKAGAEKKIQEKLASDGLLKSEKRGELDEPTRDALRHFQDSHDLPATGFPDHETIRRLGLNPDDLFSSKNDDDRSPDKQPTSR